MSSKFRRNPNPGAPRLSSCGIVESDAAFLARFVRSPGESEYPPPPPESQTRPIADEANAATPLRPKRRAKSTR